MQGGGRLGRRNVLVVNVESELFDKIAPMLDRAEFEIDRFPRAAVAMELVAHVPVDVLLIGYPLPDISIRKFLDAVRAESSPCRRSPVLLLAHDQDLEEARELVGRGANRVVAVEESAAHLQREVSSLLAVAPRRSMRAMVRMMVNIGEGSALEMTQSENLSETGMLVHTTASYPIGSRLTFEFHLGRDPLPIRGDGEVVRHTTGGRESARGIGIRFLSFERDGLARLQRHLREERRT